MTIPAKDWFSASSIVAQLEAYRNNPRVLGVAGSSNSGWENDLHRNVIPLHDQVAGKTADWLSMDTLRSASLSMIAVRHLTEPASVSNLSIRRTRFHALLAHSSAWMWLENICAYHSQPDVFNRSEYDSWPSKLARKLHDAIVELRLSNVTLTPSHYIPHLPAEPEVFQIFGNREYLDPHALPIIQQRIYHQMKHVLQMWLGFPVDPFADARAWTAQFLQAMFGIGVFLLDETWNIYVHLARTVLNRPSKNIRQMYMYQLVPFFHQIKLCEASRVNGVARRSLDNLLALHLSVFPNQLSRSIAHELGSTVMIENTEQVANIRAYFGELLYSF